MMDSFTKQWCSTSSGRDLDGRLQASGCFGDKVKEKDREFKIKNYKRGDTSVYAQIDAVPWLLSTLSCTGGCLDKNGVCRHDSKTGPCVDGLYQSQFLEPIQRSLFLNNVNYMSVTAIRMATLACYWLKPTGIANGEPFPTKEVWPVPDTIKEKERGAMIAKFYLKYLWDGKKFGGGGLCCGESCTAMTEEEKKKYPCKKKSRKLTARRLLSALLSGVRKKSQRDPVALQADDALDLGETFGVKVPKIPKPPMVPKLPVKLPIKAPKVPGLSKSSEESSPDGEGDTAATRRRRFSPFRSGVSYSAGAKEGVDSVKGALVGKMLSVVEGLFKKWRMVDLWDVAKKPLNLFLVKKEPVKAIKEIMYQFEKGTWTKAISTSLVPRVLLFGTEAGDAYKTGKATLRHEAGEQTAAFLPQCKMFTALADISLPTYFVTKQAWLMDGDQGFLKKEGKTKFDGFTFFAAAASEKWWLRTAMKHSVVSCDDSDEPKRCKVNTSPSVGYPFADQTFSSAFRAAAVCYFFNKNECPMVPELVNVKNEDGENELQWTFGAGIDDGTKLDKAGRVDPEFGNEQSLACMAKFQVNVDKCSTCW